MTRAAPNEQHEREHDPSVRLSCICRQGTDAGVVCEHVLPPFPANGTPAAVELDQRAGRFFLPPMQHSRLARPFH
jgi:hypothetical protein